MEVSPQELLDMARFGGQNVAISGGNGGVFQELELRFHPSSPDIIFELISRLRLPHHRIIDAVELGEKSRRGVRKSYRSKKGNKTDSGDIDGGAPLRYSKTIKARAPMPIGSLVLSDEAPLSDNEHLPKFLTLVLKHRFSCHLSEYPGWDMDVDVSKTLDTQEMNMVPMIRAFMDLSTEELHAEVVRNPSLYLYTVEFEYKGGIPASIERISPASIERISPASIERISPASIERMVKAVVESATPVVSNKMLYTEELARVSEALGITRVPSALRDILPQAKDLSNIEYVEMFPPVKFRATEKADGLRCLISIWKNKVTLLHKELEEYPMAYSAERTIADAEVIISGKERTLLIFDVLMLNGENVTSMTLDSRMQKIRHVVSTLASPACPELKAMEKEHIALDNPAKYREIFNGIYGKKRGYGVDGIILTERASSYFGTEIYKWKPRNEQTIDFLIKKLPHFAMPNYPSKQGMVAYVLYCTMSYFDKEKWRISFIKGHGIMTKDIVPERPKKVPVHFGTPLYPMGFLFFSPDTSLDGKIAEMGVRPNITLPDMEGIIDWELRKIRVDKDVIPGEYYGNAYGTAWNVFLNCVDEMPIDTLWTGVLSDTYFLTSKGDGYRAPVSLISYTKSMIINGLASKASVIDISSGKGQDLERYVRAKITRLVVCDIDKGAIVQLLKRWMGMVLRKGQGSQGTHPELGAFVVDIRDPWESTFRTISEKFDNLICNLAVHYFLETASSAANFASLCSVLVNEGGTASFTCMDGAKVHDLLVQTGGDRYVAEEHGAVKYSIQKKYSGNSLEPFGQKIGVLLPFSKGDHFIEYLVNVPAFTEVMKHHGFDLMVHEEMLAYEPEFLKHNPHFVGALTEADKVNLSLYCHIKYRRT